jgi:hypothetical protein
MKVRDFLLGKGEKVEEVERKSGEKEREKEGEGENVKDAEKSDSRKGNLADYLAENEFPHFEI